MKTIKYVWGEKTTPYCEFDRVKVYYTKNDKDQSAVFMNYNTDGGRDYKLVEDNHYARNQLREAERQELAEAINNNTIIIKQAEKCDFCGVEFVENNLSNWRHLCNECGQLPL